MPQEMMITLYIVFGLFVLMIARQIWLLRKSKTKKGVKSYFKAPMTMSIGERLRRKHRPFKW